MGFKFAVTEVFCVLSCLNCILVKGARLPSLKSKILLVNTTGQCQDMLPLPTYLILPLEEPDPAVEDSSFHMAHAMLGIFAVIRNDQTK